MKRAPILIVEDNPTARKLLRLALESEGYSVVEAADGAAALERMTRDAPGMVVQDLVLPDMDGLELARRLRTLPGGNEVPIVALSGFQNVLDKAASSGARFDEAFVKPMAPSLLVDAVRRYLLPNAPATTADCDTPSVHREAVQRNLASTRRALADKSALQAAQLSILAGVAQALSRSEGVDVALRDVLVSCLDAGGISKGALYRCRTAGRLELEHAVGFEGTAPEALAGCFGQPNLLGELLAMRAVVPSRWLDPEGAQRFLHAAGVRSLALVPLVHDGRCAGALLLASEVDTVTEDDLSTFGRAIGACVSQALGLSQSFARLDAIVQSNRLLFSSLDLDVTLARAARVGTQMAEFCEVRLIKDGELKHWALAHRDAEQERRAIAARRPEAPTFDADGPAFDAADVELGLVPRLEMPLVAHGVQLGVMRFCSAKHGAAFIDGNTSMAEDITRRTAVAVDNALLYREAQQANRAKDEFLTTVSHELRTPLTGILLWTTKLLSAPDPAMIHRGLTAINRCALLQAKLVDDILDVSRIITGKLELPSKLVDLKAVATAATVVVSPTAEAKGVSLDLVFDPGVAMVLGDSERLQQVLWNLLSNAVKFTPSGGHVVASVKADADTAEVTVSDDGQGIAPHFLPYVFDRFRQGDGSMSRKHGGLGLGLAIVRHLVEMHGGTVRAESEGAGRGAKITVKLPVPHALSHDGADARPRGSQSSSSEPPGASASRARLRGVRILIVDDEEDFRELFAEILSKQGAEVRSAASAEEGCALLEQFCPTVLVADLGMPGTDGYDFIRRVRAVSTIPALALTAYAGREHEVRALRAGFQMHLAKPMLPGALLNAIARLLDSTEGATKGIAEAN